MAYAMHKPSELRKVLGEPLPPMSEEEKREAEARAEEIRRMRGSGSKLSQD